MVAALADLRGFLFSMVAITGSAAAVLLCCFASHAERASPARVCAGDGMAAGDGISVRGLAFVLCLRTGVCGESAASAAMRFSSASRAPPGFTGLYAGRPGPLAMKLLYERWPMPMLTSAWSSAISASRASRSALSSRKRAACVVARDSLQLRAARKMASPR